MTEREAILARIREGLRVPAPRPGEAHSVGPLPSPGAPREGTPTEPRALASGTTRPTESGLSSAAANARQWLPKVGASFEERLAIFRENAAALKADFLLVNSLDELVSRVVELRDRERWHRIGAHGGELTDAACHALELPICRTDQPYDVNELERCDAGITECDALIAQTGSVLLTSRSAGGRALSVLVPHHVVLARRGQLIADLPDAFALIKERYGNAYPSFICFVTGPSRTGDIERILVLGAHGPKKLTIVCV